MKGATRTLLTIFVLLLDDIILVAIGLFVLWKLGIHLSPGVITALIVLLGVCFFVLYRLIRPILNGKQATGCGGMLGLEGRVTTPLTQEGIIKIRGEIWKACSVGSSISTDEEVIVVGLEGLKLLVRRKDSADEGENVKRG